MLKFTTRSQITGFVFTPSVLKVNQNMPQSLTNYEKYCIFQMVDMYQKLMIDRMYVALVQHFTNQLAVQNESWIIERQRFATIMENDYYVFLRNIPTPPLDPLVMEGIEFLKNRVSEQESVIEGIRSKLFSFEGSLFAFVYRPLLKCVYEIARYNSVEYYVNRNTTAHYDIAKITQIILNNCDIPILENKKFCNAIYSFPLISRMEDYTSNVLVAQVSTSRLDYHTLSTICNQKYLQSLDERYLFIMCKKIGTLLNRDFDDDEKNHLSSLTRKVWNMDHCGRHIFEFLLPQSLVISLFEKFGPTSLKRKREVF